ncbi:MAG: extracellular solute-binding protein [Geminicoccaceae bacterium]
MKISGKAGVLAGLTVLLSMSPAEARVELTWWHAMSGQLGAVLDEVVAKFNASQDEYELVATNKGNYVATLNAAIAAYRVGEPPLIMQASEGSVLTMMLSGAVIPAQELLEKYGYAFDPSDYLSPVLGTYTNQDGKLLAMPFNSSTPILFYNRDMLEAGGISAPPATWQDSAR